MSGPVVLITGANGQLGWELQRTAPADVSAIALDRQALDITSPASIGAALDRHRPDVVINAAAYTAVDKAEQEPERAAAANADGPRALAEAAASRGIRLIHVSTDFVFDGTAGTPYRPDAPTHPLGVYGRTKRQGEEALLANPCRSDLQIAILRTGWVYSSHGRNFVKTMLRLMGERDEVRVVADQVGTPTWARGLAEALWRIAVWRPLLQGASQGPIFHWSDAGVASWYDFAVAIQEEALSLGLLERAVPVKPITTAEYPTPARRPAYSVLDKSATWSALGLDPVHWRTALRSMLCELC
ncbi:MAG TPA: dTDP-4-dehydrorhamnose reductase [Pseudomonadales bacterium]